MPADRECKCSILEYSYRDASGYAAYDRILLTGLASEAEGELIASKLDGRQFFIPERIGIPPLQKVLYEYSGGQPTEDDHPWHEFIGFREATADEISTLPTLGSVPDLIAKFAAISDWGSGRYNWEFQFVGRD